MKAKGSDAGGDGRWKTIAGFLRPTAHRPLSHQQE